MRGENRYEEGTAESLYNEIIGPFDTARICADGWQFAPQIHYI